MTTSQQSRLGSAPEEGMKAPCITISSGQETLFGTGQTIAGVVIADMDRVAINAQTDPLENGIYVARGGKSWERATDFNASDDVESGQLMTDSNTSAVYALTIPPGGWTPGLNSISFGLLLSPVGFFWGAITGTLSNQADLQIALDAKAALVHTHVEADITDLQAYLTDAAGSIGMDGNLYGRANSAWVIIDTSVFAPAVHLHVEADITDLQPYLLDAAGSIANNNELYARANNGWQAFSTSSGTTGEIITWPDTDVPQNFLDCDGQSYNAVTFADLFAVLGYKYGGSGANFNVPDLRGVFVRGSANGSGNDPDRLSRTDRGDGTTGDAVGTKQASAVGPHGHGFSAAQPIGGYTDNGGAPDIRTTLQNKDTSQSGPGIAGDTRGINVGMNYIIRYTGGGSGITQPPSIEVQDSGVQLTTAVQLLNFIGFNLTQPLTDQIDIQYGASPNAASYCPGYPFVYLSDTSWRIDNFDVTNLYSEGRRIRFIDGAANYYGTILSSIYSGGNTTMTMSMEGGEVLTVDVTDHCIVDGGTGWVPISQDPFGGTAINDIQAGDVNGTIYWVACGDLGKAAWSKDGGLNWTVIPPANASNLNCVAFSPKWQTFIMAGDNDAFIRSTPDDPEAAWEDRTAYMATLHVSGTGQIRGIYFEDDTELWGILWQINAINTTWNINYDNAGNNAQTMTGVGMSDSGTPGPWHAMQRRLQAPNQEFVAFSLGDDVVNVTNLNSTSESSIDDFSTAVIGFEFDLLIGGVSRGFAGQEAGQIEVYNSLGFDDVTFGSSSVNGISWSPVHERAVAVADDGKIGWLDQGDITAHDAWQLAQNGSNPLANFRQVRWNTEDGLFIAVNDMGQILRNATGITPLPPAPAYTGWTPIAADPFSGGNIDFIETGVIAGVQWWVIASSTLLFTSTDAGITWTSRTHGTGAAITCLAYDSSSEAFVIGCANGDFSRTVDGPTWVADTTTVNALGLAGSGKFNGMVWSPAAGLWTVFLEANVAASATFSVDALLTTFTIRDLTTNQANSGSNNTVFYQPWRALQSIWCGIGATFNYYVDPTDVTPTNSNNMSETITAAFGKSGSFGALSDLFVADSDGDIELQDGAVGILAVNNGVFNGPVNAFSWSSMAGRMIAVGDAGQIYTQEAADFRTINTWYLVTPPFSGNIRNVKYNATDNMFICVCSDGVIARSVDGIS